MTKIIQLVGALLGTLLGFALGLLILQKSSTLIDAPNRPAFLMAMVAATLLFGYLAIPYVTVRPARWAVDRLAAGRARGVRASAVGGDRDRPADGGACRPAAELDRRVGRIGPAAGRGGRAGARPPVGDHVQARRPAARPSPGSCRARVAAAPSRRS